MAKTVSQMLAIKPPAGFSWVGTRGSLRAEPNNEKIKLWILGLYKWAKENDIGLTPTDYMYVSSRYYDCYVWYSFSAEPGKFKEQTYPLYGNGTFKGSCGHIHKVGEWLCAPSPNSLGTTLLCQGCYKGGLATTEITRASGAKILLCGLCATACTKCGANTVYSAERRHHEGDAKTQCESCCPSFKCTSCKKFKTEKDKHSVTPTTGGEKINVCTACNNSKTCQLCHKFSKTALTAVAGVNCCAVCSTKKANAERVKHERFTVDELPKGGSIQIPTLPERPFRPISIETEVDGDRQFLSNTLYNCGIVRVPDVEAYGTETPVASSWAAFLKHDGSVTGGELISYLLQLDKTEHADAFLNTLAKIRSLAKVGKVEFNANCGGHIHIDAHNFDSANIWRLLTTWNYLEDIIYRLAGAGHSYGHRTQVPGHDRANGGGGYANSPAKGPWGVKSNVTRAIEMQNRMCGLNFKPYLSAVRSCSCGAQERDALRTCTCTLPKCTIEWRVWNSQGNPRILHAWIAFMQAMHAYADVDEEPTAEFEKEHPALAWTNRKFDKTPPAHQLTVKKRLEWIFSNLVFTEAERDSLAYTIKQTDLSSLGADYIDGLAKIAGPKDVAPRLARTPKIKRSKAIVIKAPEPDADPLAQLSRAEREQLLYQRRRNELAMQGW